MNKRVMYHKKTGKPIQLVAQAQAIPNYQEVICFQELTEPYEYYVMEKRLFSSTYVRSFDELPQKDRERIEEHNALPDKKAGRMLRRKKRAVDPESGDPIEMEGPIGMGGPIGMDGPLAQEEPEDEMTARMMTFFDSRSYAEKLKIFEDMKDANEHILTNIAVSMDIPLEDAGDAYDRILSELKLRKKFEVRDRRPE
ncbi:MAG: hypothetical protein IKQ97_09555 [Eubacterium sp.]|nr:hypothetical protein [Eubacterium sp.]